MKHDLHDAINHRYFALDDKGINTYMKQRIVMQVYHNLKHLGRTLKDVWAQVNLYFEALNGVYHTCKYVNIDPYENSINGVTYWGD